METRPDQDMECANGCGKVPHRWRPSPEAGLYWRCSECGEPTVFAEDVLGYLHGSIDIPEDASRSDKMLDRLLGDLDEMLDIASLGALARAFHKVDEPPTPHASTCDRILREVDVSRVSILLMMSLVRFTARHRAQLPAWYDCRDRVVAEMKARKHPDWRETMLGLLDLEPA